MLFNRNIFLIIVRFNKDLSMRYLAHICFDSKNCNSTSGKYCVQPWREMLEK